MSTVCVQKRNVAKTKKNAKVMLKYFKYKFYYNCYVNTFFFFFYCERKVFLAKINTIKVILLTSICGLKGRNTSQICKNKNKKWGRQSKILLNNSR